LLAGSRATLQNPDMRILISRSGRIAFAALIVASIAGAQDTTRVTPRVVGRILGVFDTQSALPLEGADVIDRIGGSTLRTQRSGLVGLAAFTSQHDSSVVTVRKIGYADTTVLVMTGATDTVPVQIFLRHVTALDSMIVTAKEVEHAPLYLKDFEERMLESKITGAKTVGPGEMRKNDGRKLYDFLLGKGIGSGQRCRSFGIYLNGAPYRPLVIAPGSPGIPDDEVDHYDAVVFYTGAQMPMEFRRTGGGCAALLLYARGK
jgi:hypothetical protein